MRTIPGAHPKSASNLVPNKIVRINIQTKILFGLIL